MGQSCMLESVSSPPSPHLLCKVWSGCCSDVCLGKMLFSSFLALHCGKSSGICGVVLIQENFWKQSEGENSSCQMQESAERCTFLKNC